MTDSIDYSRPVGWWCPVSGLDGCVCGHGIPRYLPIPEGQRPPAASEVEEAEVVTWTSPVYGDTRITSNPPPITLEGLVADGHEFVGDFPDPTAGVDVINRIAQTSARARIDSQHVTGATE